MSRPDSPQPSQQQPMEMPLGEWLRGLAIQRVRGTGSTPRTRPLWSTMLPAIGLGGSLVLELLPTLALRVRNLSKGDVLIETEPVDFGSLVTQGKAIEDRDAGQALVKSFEQWCEERRSPADGSTVATSAVTDASPPAAKRKRAATKAAPSQPPAEGGAS